jgi:transposase-like protein
VLWEQEAGLSTAEVCRKHGISTATFYAWKAKFGGGMDVSEADATQGRHRKEAAGARYQRYLPGLQCRLRATGASLATLSETARA